MAIRWLFFETVPAAGYLLDQPFAVRLHKTLGLRAPLVADWKEMFRSQWSMS